VEEGLLPKHQPKFFREVDHPFVKNEDIDSHEQAPKFYQLIEERGYWERRENQDWSDLPNLWSGFDE
jgi:hypothetical protein